MNLKERLREALLEDIGSGDVTSEALIPETDVSRGYFLAKEEGILCGVPFALEVFRLLDPNLEEEIILKEGDRLLPWTVFLRIKGKTRAILGGERVALNLLSHLSGIATRTNNFVRIIQGTKAKILDTRKTTPLWRDLEKYAVRTGGGQNHRMGLFDMALIKDNHIRAKGGIKEALKSARENLRPGVKVEIEVTNFEEFLEALEGNPDWIMLDNMPPSEIRKCVEKGKGKVILEASGGITEENIREIAETGVDYISLGALTHSVKALDISLELEEN
ncbi:MAG: carboxylating nicotinate-nucleotide diphosphorylase [Caldiserica bacterium]|nr:carboxylating nicotinate-nucleotide diphosphorylase [Caldisericota bacterium]MDH7562334.1 carboxylating nicotinate-nucleotide diphosphorylase [Caldisericota bacterium]